MKSVLYVLCISTALSAGFSCIGTRAVVQEQAMNSNSSSSSSPSPSPSISEEMAVNVARNDFVRVMGSLDGFIIDKSEQGNEWRIVIRRKEEALVGVGVVYIIDKRTGNISRREFYQ